MTGDVDQIRKLAVDYFDGLHEGDVGKLGGVFHKRSRLHVITKGELTEMDLPTYLKVVEGRDSPKKLGSPRKDQVLGIAVTSPDAAVLTVRLLLFDKDFTDQLALIKDQGKWQIMSKIYFLNNPPK